MGKNMVKRSLKCCVKVTDFLFSSRLSHLYQVQTGYRLNFKVYSNES